MQPSLFGPESIFTFASFTCQSREALIGRIRKIGGLNASDTSMVQTACQPQLDGNTELSALNPAGERKVERFGWTCAPGDKLMQIENNYDQEVYDGDIGYIDDVDPEVGELVASFDGRSVTYGFGELDTLVPAYAATIDKSQGSEYPAMIIPVLTQHYPMLQRNLLYTGVTCGKRLGYRRPEEGHRDRRSQRIGPATLVKTRRMASARRALPNRRIHRRLIEVR
jgi:hypothetical protein